MSNLHQVRGRHGAGAGVHPGHGRGGAGHRDRGGSRWSGGGGPKTGGGHPDGPQGGRRLLWCDHPVPGQGQLVVLWVVQRSRYYPRSRSTPPQRHWPQLSRCGSPPLLTWPMSRGRRRAPWVGGFSSASIRCITTRP